MASSLPRLLVLATALLSLLVARQSSAEPPRDSYLEALMVSHGGAAVESQYGAPHYSAPTSPSYPPPQPSYGPPTSNGYLPQHHHLHHHAYGPPMMMGENGNGLEPGNGDNGGGGGGGGVDIATFMHAMGKILVVKIIVKLVAIIFALLFLPKIKEKKKRPQKPQHHDEEEEEDEEDEEEDEEDERRRSIFGTAKAFGTSSKDPRLIALLQRVTDSIEKQLTNDKDLR